jgi:hypothetical protein
MSPAPPTFFPFLTPEAVFAVNVINGVVVADLGCSVPESIRMRIKIKF